MKSEVIDQSALKGAVGSVVSVARETKDEVVSKEPKNRGGRAYRAREIGVTESPDGVACAANVMEDALDSDFTEAELREFLAADYLETRADPTFKESLREKLWTLVSNRHGRGPSSAK